MFLPLPDDFHAHLRQGELMPGYVRDLVQQFGRAIIMPNTVPAMTSAKAIAEYKQIRPIIQFGDLYRLVSPYDHKGLASMMYTTEKKDKAVFFWWKTESFQNEHLPRVRMAGLDPNRLYKVHELNRVDQRPLDCEGKSYSGAYLMSHGLELPGSNNVEWNKKTDWSSRVLLLE